MPFDDDDRDLDFDDRIDPTKRKKNKAYRPKDDDDRGGKKHYDRKRENRRMQRDWGDDYDDYEDSFEDDFDDEEDDYEEDE